MLISSSRQMPPIEAMRDDRQFAPRVKQTPPKWRLTKAVRNANEAEWNAVNSFNQPCSAPPR